jgi:hypothetical protein
MYIEVQSLGSHQNTKPKGAIYFKEPYRTFIPEMGAFKTDIL